ncbi:adenylate kinase 7-like isoform X2 [Melanotaenia boesemani]|uniref:adenylate kinase 7-like isoform X2 n=1 Tax=Melanotaenia boesemani TaxID=1250792 RepID=UPI001C03F581|nr:adenylate kinase 7-like isoform X2 [Melanotaenia boesemani]
MAEKKQQSRPKRIFVNDVDSYSSKHIAKLLSKCEAGKTSEDEEAELGPLRGEPPFYIVGTVSSSLSNDGKLDFVREQYTFPSRDELFQLLLECDVVVYNISESSTQQQVEEAEWAITALHAEMANFKSRKMFILVSTVMTWVMTKLPHLDDIEPLISEEDFRYKMPHPSFRNHNKVEKLVLKLAREKKSKLKCYVISSGIQYGMGENLFHYFFKVSWLMQLPKVPIFGQGTNHIPMIHVYDLGGVIQNIIEQRPKSKYILATDDSKNTLQTIVKVISDVLGPEKVQKFSLQDAITMKAFKPEELDCLSINLQLDAYIVKEFNINWKSKTGMVENMETIVQEYKDTRQLLPIRICLVGPPAVGKTTVAEKLCQHYQIHHITIKGIIEEKITQLNGLISGADPECVNEEAAAAAQKQLESINKSLEINQGRLTEEQVFDILQNKLYSKPCRNQGFVLDGFPKTYSQAQIHFFDMERQDSDVMPNKPQYNKLITPEHVFALDASDDFLMKRVQGLPESVAVKMRYTQDEFVPRLSRYRQLSNAEETLLDFFDQREIHPEHIEVNADDPEYTDVIKKIMESVGVPKNYGLSPEKQKEEDQKREDERKQKLTAETAKNKQRKEAALAEMVAQYEEWKNLSEVTRQECELLEACSLPLRNYLMKYIIPSLTEAMTECCKIKPEDPVDFVAEYLLRSNQE